MQSLPQTLPQTWAVTLLFEKRAPGLSFLFDMWMVCSDATTSITETRYLPRLIRRQAAWNLL